MLRRRRWVGGAGVFFDGESMRPRLAEFIGTAFLLVAVVGSGIMAERLAGGNVGLALLANSVVTGAALYVLITIFGPVSGAHFNPVVTGVFWLRREITGSEAVWFVGVQVVGGIIGVFCAHLMFGLPVIEFSKTARQGTGQWFAEAVATFGLILTILGCVRYRADAVATAVGLYILAAYWFTASTSFANPAVTVARCLTATFAGIAPGDVVMFVVMQVVGAVAAFGVARIVFGGDGCGSD